MNKEFIPYEQALALKELGFDESCFGVYSEHDKTRVYEGLSIREGLKIQVPLYQQAFRFFREKYNLLGGVYSNASGWAWEIHDNIGGTHRFSSEYTGDCLESGMFTSFEKAELNCIKYLIEIVKNK
jgi:hypothetical protein